MAVENSYATVEELRTQLGDASSKMDVTLLERALNAASRAIDRHCGRRFWLDSTVKVREYRPDDVYEADIDDIGATAGLIVKTDTTGDGTWATTWDSGDYQLEPLNVEDDTGDAYAWWRLVAIDDKTFPLHARRTTLQVTAKWGWSEVPHDVTEACLLRATALFKRREAPFGVAGFNQFGPVRISREDRDLQDLLRPYVKFRVRVV